MLHCVCIRIAILFDGIQIRFFQQHELIRTSNAARKNCHASYCDTWFNIRTKTKTMNCTYDVLVHPRLLGCQYHGFCLSAKWFTWHSHIPENSHQLSERIQEKKTRIIDAPDLHTLHFCISGPADKKNRCNLKLGIKIGNNFNFLIHFRCNLEPELSWAALAPQHWQLLILRV